MSKMFYYCPKCGYALIHLSPSMTSISNGYIVTNRGICAACDRSYTWSEQYELCKTFPFIEENPDEENPNEEYNLEFDEEQGTVNGDLIYCPSMDSSCPYLDHNGVCHIGDSLHECTDFQDAWDSWKDYLDTPTYTE